MAGRFAFHPQRNGPTTKTERRTRILAWGWCRLALNEIACRMIAPFFDGRVLCLGVPIVLLSDEQCRELFRVKPSKYVEAPGWANNRKTPDPYDIAEKLGVDLTCVDAIAHDGRELVADLNYPHDFGQFDLVIDAGTTEHCLNVGQAIVNACNAVKVGGLIFHTNPVSMGNHAFYNFCPTLLFDFYQANGFEVLGAEVRDRNGEGEPVKWHPTLRFPLGNNWGMYFLAERKSVVPLTWAIQGKYK